ncbi:putative Pleckstrin-like proteiny domain-containing family G member 7 [Hypsibius exemplaris]|uniref:Pleckstrin-like proteiny domain-containing family G member 7 n=1 Tax=Hypsibius exemplaris TaxID=2072580 RepID=A0A1W0WJG4_HYPEX|nr:putative Pleckstrin-like proteiny domain-containing family G member 7 [Hypsibius exemplaris]
MPPLVNAAINWFSWLSSSIRAAVGPIVALTVTAFVSAFFWGLSKAKSEDRSRSYTIPNLPTQQISAVSAVVARDAILNNDSHQTAMKTYSSHPDSLALLPPSSPRSSSPNPSHKAGGSSSSLIIGSIPGSPYEPSSQLARSYSARRHLTADVILPEITSPETPNGMRSENAPSFAVLQHRRSALLPFQGFGEPRRQSSLSGSSSPISFGVAIVNAASSTGAGAGGGGAGGGSKSGEQSAHSAERISCNTLSVSPQQGSPRRRSSVVVIPPMQICPGDLLVYGSNPSTVNSSGNGGSSTSGKPPKSAFSFERHTPYHSVKESPDPIGSTASLQLSETGSGAGSGEGRKKPWSIMKLFDRSSRTKSEIGNLEDQLLTLKTSEFEDNALMRYKILHWSDLTPVSDDLSESEIKRREAIWEMFQSELVLLMDHLLVIKHVFLEPLKQLQVEGFVMHVEPDKLFGNLDELCAANYELCVNFAEMMEDAAKELEPPQFVSIDRIVDLLHKTSVQEFESDDETALTFQRYCLNYINALNYLESVRKHEDFNEYEKFCSQDRRCHRLQLTDLLVTPVQHTMKRPLLLREICKHSEKCGYDCTRLKSLLEETESSLRGLDEKINWLRNFEKLQAIQKQLIWPSVIDLQDPKIYIPEVLKQHLAKQPCEGLILSPRRIIVQEGTLFMIENGKPVEMQVFLFDDMLLLTRKRKGLFKKQKSSVSDPNPGINSWSVAESSTRYIVYKQPMPLDRIMVHDMSPPDQGGGALKNSIVILHISRYQQIIGAVTLQASTEALKVLWLSKLRMTMDRWRSVHFDHKDTLEHSRNQISSVSEF